MPFVKRFVSLQFLKESVELFGRANSQLQGRYLHRTSHRINTRAFNGIRTQDPSVAASEDISCLRPRGNCDRHIRFISLLILIPKGLFEITMFVEDVAYSITLKILFIITWSEFTD
jgi:hypothetical protein